MNVWTMILLGACLVCCSAARAAGDAPVELRDDEALAMVHTGGWGAGRLAEFRVKRDGSFTYATRAERQAQAKEVRGTLTAAQVAGLRQSIAGAAAGTGAEDAGVVQFLWRDDAGKAQQRDYTMPRREPCAALVKAVQALADGAAKP